MPACIICLSISVSVMCVGRLQTFSISYETEEPLQPWPPSPFNRSVYKGLEKHCQTYCSPCLPSCAPCSRLWAEARLLWDLEHDKIVAGPHGDGGIVHVRLGWGVGGWSGMCGKPRKTLNKMGTLGQKCSTLVLWLLKIGVSHIRCRSWKCGCEGINSFLSKVMCYHFSCCVLLLRLLYPFIDGVLSQVYGNN